MRLKPGREPRECGFCGESWWVGRGDIDGNFLCLKCCERAEALLADERRRSGDA